MAARGDERSSNRTVPYPSSRPGNQSTGPPPTMGSETVEGFEKVGEDLDLPDFDEEEKDHEMAPETPVEAVPTAGGNGGAPPMGEAIGRTKSGKPKVVEGIQGKWLTDSLQGSSFQWDTVCGAISGEYTLPPNTTHLNTDKVDAVASGNKELSYGLDLKKGRAFLFTGAKPRMIYSCADKLKVARENGHYPILGFFWNQPSMCIPGKIALRLAPTPYTMGTVIKEEAKPFFVGKCAFTTGLHTISRIRGELVPFFKMTQMLFVTLGEIPDELASMNNEVITSGPTYQLSGVDDGADVIWFDCEDKYLIIYEMAVIALTNSNNLVRKKKRKSIFATADTPRSIYSIVVRRANEAHGVLNEALKHADCKVAKSNVFLGVRSAFNLTNTVLIEGGPVGMQSLLDHMLDGNQIFLLPISRTHWLAQGIEHRHFQVIIAIINSNAADKDGKIWGYTTWEGAHVSHKVMRLSLRMKSIFVSGSLADRVEIPLHGNFSDYVPGTLERDLNELLQLACINGVGGFSIIHNAEKDYLTLYGSEQLRTAVQSRLCGSITMVDQLGRYHAISFDNDPEEASEPLTIGKDLATELIKISPKIRKTLADAKKKSPAT